MSDEDRRVASERRVKLWLTCRRAIVMVITAVDDYVGVNTKAKPN